jgi:hypothetical protein
LYVGDPSNNEKAPNIFFCLSLSAASADLEKLIWMLDKDGLLSIDNCGDVSAE